MNWSGAAGTGGRRGEQPGGCQIDDGWRHGGADVGRGGERHQTPVATRGKWRQRVKMKDDGLGDLDPCGRD